MYYFEILEGLYKSKVRYLIVGGLSVNLYGVPRITQDIDIVIAMSKENILKITSLLKGLDYIPRLPVNPDDLANHDKVKDWIENKNLKAFSFYHKKEHTKVVDIVLEHPLDFTEAFQRGAIKKVDDIEIYPTRFAERIELTKNSL